MTESASNAHFVDARLRDLHLPADQSQQWVASELESTALTIPANIYSVYSHLGSDWQVPLGAHSKQKKAGVPLTQIEKPDSRLPDVWGHPAATMMDGKCGITGIANMLRLYGIEKNPADLDLFKYKSWGPGLQAGKFAENMTEISGLKFTAREIDERKEDPLGVLRDNLNSGKPVAIMYMTGQLEAHWVVVTGVNDGKDGPELSVMSWGQYHKIKWNDLKYQWSRGWGGPYPYIVGDDPCELLKKK